MENYINKAENIKQPYYFKEVLKKYTVFLPLFIISLLCTLAYVSDYYNILSIFKDFNLKTSYFLLSVLFFICFLTFISFLSKINSKNIYAFDAMIVPLLAFIAIYISYCLFTKINLERALPVFIFLPLCIFFMVYRLIAYYKNNNKVIENNSNFSKTNDKYTPFLPLFIAVSFFIALIYLYKSDFKDTIFTFFENKLYMYILLGISAIISIIFITFCFLKKTKFIDLTMYSVFYFLILLFLKKGTSFFIDNYLSIVLENNYILYAILGAFSLILIILSISVTYSNNLFFKILKYLITILPLAFLLYVSLYNGIDYNYIAISSIYFICYLALVIRGIKNQKNLL